jgi:hypothetical protein
MDKILKVPSAIEKITTMRDKSLRIWVDTPELSPEDMATLMALYGKEGVFVFSVSDIKEEDMLDLPEVKVERGEKTPGQRLRGVLYVLWEQSKTGKTFDEFYRDYMSKLIETIKGRLD